MFLCGRSRGATLIDAIVSTALLAVVFVGIAGAFQLSIDVVTNNKARAGAIALSNERLEFIRSLPYDQVGVVGGIPAGLIPQTETVTLNGITYTRRTLVLYADDPKDGLAGADTNGIIADYRAVKVEVSWIAHNGGTRAITLATRVSPIGVEQLVPGGTLALTVLNAASLPLENALVTIVNTSVVPVVNMAVNSSATGQVTVIGAPSGAGYKITVTKPGFSTDKTHDSTAENTSPAPGHLTVSNNQTTSATFSIDATVANTIRSFTPIENATTTDSFGTAGGIVAQTDVDVSGGELVLSGMPGTYALSGTARSTAIAPSRLSRWTLFDWNDTRPALTNILYRVYTGDGSALVPDGELPGNSTGFSAPPINLSTISTSTYPSLSLHATLGTADVNETPRVESWSIGYDSGPTPLPNLIFSLHGTKTVGSGPGGVVYKYSTSTNTNSSGVVTFGSLEWDTYTLSVDGATTGYDIASSCVPQPMSLAPDTIVTTNLILEPHTTNSLLVEVRAGGVLIPQATVRLTRGAYDTTVMSDSCGQAFFGGMSAGSPGGGNPYTISVTAPGYGPFTATDVTVSGTSKLSVVLN